MEKTTLVIMAAGMGSRYGGLKQIDAVDEQGHAILDFSVYDAVRAGFDKVLFVIRPDFEKDFQEVILQHLPKEIEADYVFQTLETGVPTGVSLPPMREKPWGTGHAVLCCKEKIDGPFAVINADDFYGVQALRRMHQFLSEVAVNHPNQYAMVGYYLKNTLTDFGFVSRGVCEVGENGKLQSITERTHIERRGEQIAFTEDEGVTWHSIAKEQIVSMNLWGFHPAFLDELEWAFHVFITEKLPHNPEKGEMYLPAVVQQLLLSGKAEVEVLKTPDRWYGVTYQEDKPLVQNAIMKMKAEGIYPSKF